jgi:hypothetical protein
MIMATLTKKTKITPKSTTKKASTKVVKKPKERIFNDEGEDISRYITKGKGNPKDFEKYAGFLKDTGIKPFER